MTTGKYYIGLMSGTSADGVDLALVNFSSNQPELVAHYYRPYSDNLSQKITALYSPNNNEIDLMGTLDVELAHYFAKQINALLAQENLTCEDIIAIGNHGQTIRHRPVITKEIAYPYTLQIGCSQTLACLTKIRVIGDFRTKDIALGGQGAPLVPAFHQYLFSKTAQDTFIVNLGGIANITFLPHAKNAPIIGFDTGPANALLDLWCLLNTGQRYDKNGDWAAQGTVNQHLLQAMLADEYFAQPAPKSTGREYFNETWLRQHTHGSTLPPEDIQATLAMLSAQSIANEINKLSPKSIVYLCGGGIDNNYSYKLLKHELSKHIVKTIHSLQLNNNAFEAMAFAWLSFAYDKKFYGNIPTVTGACKQTVLGIEFTP